MSDRLFDLDEIPEVPLFREPPPGRGALIMDERISHDYPSEWHQCQWCHGSGQAQDAFAKYDRKCDHCLGMGSVKAMVRLLAGHRCERCGHPYVPKGDAKMLGIEPSAEDGGRWSACDERCSHGGPVKIPAIEVEGDDWIMTWAEIPDATPEQVKAMVTEPVEVYAAWRILTVHHLSGDKADCRWGNLAALCQRCHLEIQAKVVLERVWLHEHSTWFKPHAAWWYALSYLGEDLTRDEVMGRLDELLGLERV